MTAQKMVATTDWHSADELVVETAARMVEMKELNSGAWMAERTVASMAERTVASMVRLRAVELDSLLVE